jgi:hypothetical protein
VTTLPHPASLLLACVLPSLPAALPLHAQSGADLVLQASALHVERLTGVENLTLTQEIMGIETVAYMEKREVDGMPTLVTVSMRAGGMAVPVDEGAAAMSVSGSVPAEWAQRTRLVGRDQVDGRPVHVLSIDDFTGLTVPGPPAGESGGGDFHPSSMRFTLDTETLLMRSMDMVGELRREGAPPTPVEMHIEAGDYREVEGYWHPFRTRMVTRGALAGAGTDSAEMRAQVAEMRSRLEGMPPEQRAMVESMVLPQIERFEAMLGDDDSVEVVATVIGLRVNAGAP